jgi:hypothetical protein
MQFCVCLVTCSLASNRIQKAGPCPSICTCIALISLMHMPRKGTYQAHTKLQQHYSLNSLMQMARPHIRHTRYYSSTILSKNLVLVDPSAHFYIALNSLINAGAKTTHQAHTKHACRRESWTLSIRTHSSCHSQFGTQAGVPVVDPPPETTRVLY